MTQQTPAEVGPLGPGRAPVKDPMKGLRGVMAGVLILEAITIFLALTVVLKVNGGAYWTPFNWGFITALGAVHILLAFVQRFPWALPAALGVQVVGIVGGLFVHWSLSATMVVFAIVWWYVLVLRRNLLQRMSRGLLTTQHLGVE
ncbi:DUF4233 domain-containing protein [Corynebacterium uterequi]|uniref:Putative DUF4233 family protein n=1 Tax=Corynebacterium uterequi TaxID=1072256 RepID=A0A0G3HFZ3_9CORY|nr:DUF4233 domain-containing protein [Corynebacterium uterequi]AKK11645.1 putative DUF4233 family protein [Corynebacterium uterequi]